MLTDDDLTSALRDAFKDATDDLHPADSLGATVLRRYRRRRKAVLAARIAAPCLVAAAVITSLGLSGTHDPSSPAAQPPAATSTPSQPGTSQPQAADRDQITLDGYIVALPAGYTVTSSSPAHGDTNCTSALHLAPGERRRMISNPGSDCPLLLASVTAALPQGAARQELPGKSYNGQPAPQSVIWYNAPDSDGRTVSFFPAKLPGGTTVYVSFAATAKLNYQQIIELANGVRVSPDPKTCTSPCG